MHLTSFYVNLTCKPHPGPSKSSSLKCDPNSNVLQGMPVYSQGLESLLEAGFRAFFVGGGGGVMYLSWCRSVHLFLGTAMSFQLLDSADAVRKLLLRVMQNVVSFFF